LFSGEQAMTTVYPTPQLQAKAVPSVEEHLGASGLGEGSANVCDEEATEQQFGDDALREEGAPAETVSDAKGPADQPTPQDQSAASPAQQTEEEVQESAQVKERGDLREREDVKEHGEDQTNVVVIL
jgi:hypothetical protein